MDEQTKQEQELITIAGGVEMEVAYNKNGASEIVKVRQIPISKMQSFVLAMGNEAKTIEMYCDKPEGWADTLTNKSANAIANKGQEINIPFFGDWFRRQMKWRESQEPGSTTSGTQVKSGEPGRSESSSVLGSSAPLSPTTTT